MPKRKYRCTNCEVNKNQNEFFKTKREGLWRKYGGRFPVCKDCINEYFNELKIEYSPEEAMLDICGLLGIPYISKIFRTFYNRSEEINVGQYIRLLNTRKNKSAEFAESILKEENRAESITRPPGLKTTWTISDKRNKRHVLDVLGFDPFSDRDINDVDKKLSYNILSGFCDADDIRNDTHKIQSCIELTNLHVQMDKIERELDRENNKGKKNLDAISTLTALKKNLVETINKISRDNKIGAQYNSDRNKGSNTLTGKMKEMDNEKLIESKVNRFDMKTCEAMQQISDINMKSILSQLNLDDGDYAKMIADMREINMNQTTEIDKLEEEVRLLRNRIKGLGYEC